MTASKRVCLGTVVGPHGVRGAVRIRSETERAEDIGAYGPLSDETGDRMFELRVVGHDKGIVQARIAGIEDRDAAEALRGVRLYVERDRLPPAGRDEYYHADLIGLRADLAEGDVLGTVRGVVEFGAGDLLEIELASGDTVFVPFTKAVVPEVDIAGGKVVIRPPAGLLDRDKAAPGERGEDG